MWLMVLCKSLYVALGATTGFVFAFGVGAAVFLDNVATVVSCTAAYAAVLVVFVGTRSG